MNAKVLLLLFLFPGQFVWANATIDRINLTASHPYFSYPTLYPPVSVANYVLSDGSSWPSGAGVTYVTAATYQSATVSGGFVTYHFAPLANGMLFQNTDYGYGANFSTAGTLGYAGDFNLVAQLGSTVATVSGATTILANPVTFYPDVFHSYSAPVGEAVYFQMNFTLTSGTWQQNTFEAGGFNYTGSGYVDFTQVIPEPTTAALLIVGGGLLFLHRQKSRSQSRR